MVGTVETDYIFFISDTEFDEMTLVELFAKLEGLDVGAEMVEAIKAEQHG